MWTLSGKEPTIRPALAGSEPEEPRPARDSACGGVPLTSIGRPRTAGIFGKTVTTATVPAKPTTLILVGTIAAGLTVGPAVVGYRPLGMMASPTLPAAQAPAAELVESPRQADELMARSAAALEARRSIVANIRQTVDLFGAQATATAAYAELKTPQGPLVRLQWESACGTQPLRLCQLSDGWNLWTYQFRDGSDTLQRIDLDYLNRAVRKWGNSGDLIEAGKTAVSRGLEKFVAGLRTQYIFHQLGQTQLADSRPVWIVAGTWRTNCQAAEPQGRAGQGGAGEGRADDAALARLPEQVPTRVVVFLGQADLFPYRVEFRRRQASPLVGAAGTADRLLAAIDFTDVRLDAPLDPRHFAFDPGSAAFTDQTDAVLKELGLSP